MSDPSNRAAAVEAVQSVVESVVANVGRAIIGKDDEVRLCLITLLCGGHLLIEDVPGVGKTMLAKSLARSLDCSFRRVQFTPDLLPSDVTGVRAFNQRTSDFEFRAGPVFAQILLADEINRATPKTQSALLEAMEEGQVTVDGETHELPNPFLVMATQNPVEYARTYPMPEAQLNRFMMKVRLGYLNTRQEADLMGRDRIESPLEELEPVVSPTELRLAQQAVGEVFVKPELREYIARLVERTRSHPDIALGVSTRGSLTLHSAAQARAALQGRQFVQPDDIKALAQHVLAHRLILRPSAEMQGMSAEGVLGQLIDHEFVPQLSYDD